jgi:hypothetical protein
LAEFEAAVKKTHGHRKHAIDYMKWVSAAKAYMEIMR